MTTQQYMRAFKEYIDEENDVSLRELARKYKCSKSALQRNFLHIAERSRDYANAYDKKAIRNFETKSIRGGEATRQKYLNTVIAHVVQVKESVWN